MSRVESDRGGGGGLHGDDGLGGDGEGEYTQGGIFWTSSLNDIFFFGLGGG